MAVKSRMKNMARRVADIGKLARVNRKKLFEHFKGIAKPRALRHCEKVNEVAVKIARALKKSGVNVDVEAVNIASFAHDIWRHEDNHEKLAHDFFIVLNRPDLAKMVAATYFPRNTLFSRRGSSWANFRIEDNIVEFSDSLVQDDRVIDWVERVKRIEQRYAREGRLTKANKVRFLQQRKFLSEFENWLMQNGVNLKVVLRKK